MVSGTRALHKQVEGGGEQSSSPQEADDLSHIRKFFVLVAANGIWVFGLDLVLEPRI